MHTYLYLSAGIAIQMGLKYFLELIETLLLDGFLTSVCEENLLGQTQYLGRVFGGINIFHTLYQQLLKSAFHLVCQLANPHLHPSQEQRVQRVQIIIIF